MTPTQERLDQLAKVFQLGQTGDTEGWEDLALDPDYMSDDTVASTRDTLDDFRQAARESWAEASKAQEIDVESSPTPNALYWDRVQTTKGEPRVALAVLDCGEFRICYQQ